MAEALPALRSACEALARRGEAGATARACGEAARLPPGLSAPVRSWLRRRFAAEALGEGLVTGYYEPLLRVSPTPDARHAAPLLGWPPGREGPLPERAAIRALVAAGTPPAPVLAWADPADAFFLEIQGSGRALFPDGTLRRLGYAGRNGHPYVAVGRVLVERGAMRLEEVSLGAIRAWMGAAGPEAAAALMDANPSQVFFRWRDELAPGEGPVGTLGAPLVPGRGAAVDPAHAPLGLPLWLSVPHPLGGRPVERLVVAADTGGAIRGRARLDLFWGWGEAAEAAAGPMRARGRVWALRPRG